MQKYYASHYLVIISYLIAAGDAVFVVARMGEGLHQIGLVVETISANIKWIYLYIRRAFLEYANIFTVCMSLRAKNI